MPEEATWEYDAGHPIKSFTRRLSKPVTFKHLSVALIVLIAFLAVFFRYDYAAAGGTYDNVYRIDRWTGSVYLYDSNDDEWNRQ